MRIVTNSRHASLHRYLATAASLTGLGLLVVSLLYPIIRPEAGMTSPPFLLVVIAIAVSIAGLRLSTYWLRLPIPQDALESGLKGFGPDTILCHYKLPAPHVLIYQRRVFCLTTLPQAVRLRVMGDRWTRTEGALERFSSLLFRQDTLGNPQRRARRQATRLQRWLDKRLPENSARVRPIVVLTSPEASLETVNPMTSIVYADKRKPSLKTTLRNMPREDTLTSEELHTLHAALGLAD